MSFPAELFDSQQRIVGYEWAGIDIPCSRCGAEVSLLVEELDSLGNPPKTYICAECE